MVDCLGSIFSMKLHHTFLPTSYLHFGCKVFSKTKCLRHVGVGPKRKGDNFGGETSPEG